MSELDVCFCEEEISNKMNQLRAQKAPMNGVIRDHLPKWLQRITQRQNEMKLRKRAIRELEKLKRQCLEKS